jgi:hypothetical protein
MLGESQLGVIATAGFDNKWRSRDNIEQSPGSFDLSVIDKDYRRVSTENHAVTNALVGLGYEFGDGNKLRWTNLYIHDTLKRTSLAEGFQNNQRPGADFLEQTTAWYERQLTSTQLTGELAGTGDARRPRVVFEVQARSAVRAGLGHVHQPGRQPHGRLLHQSPGQRQTGYATATFSTSRRTWKSAGGTHDSIRSNLTLTAGYDYTSTERESDGVSFRSLLRRTSRAALPCSAGLPAERAGHRLIRTSA